MHITTKNDTWLVIIFSLGLLIGLIVGIPLGIKAGRIVAIDDGYFEHEKTIYRVEKFSELNYPKLKVKNNE